MSKRLFWVLTSLLVLAMLMAACGGGGAAPEPATEQPQQQEEAAPTAEAPPADRDAHAAGDFDPARADVRDGTASGAGAVRPLRVHHRRCRGSISDHSPGTDGGV